MSDAGDRDSIVRAALVKQRNDRVRASLEAGLRTDKPEPVKVPLKYRIGARLIARWLKGKIDMKKILGLNWKTTLGGIGILLAALAKVATGIAANGITAEDVTILIGGISGFIACLNAKDSNVTGAGPTAVAK
jgi:hypothetical protein